MALQLNVSSYLPLSHTFVYFPYSHDLTNECLLFICHCPIHSYISNPVLLFGSQTEHVTRELVSTLAVNGKLIAFPVIFPCHTGHNLNKLFAKSKLLGAQILL